MPEPENEKCIRLKIDCPPKKDGGLKEAEDRQREKQDMMNRKYPKQKIIIKGGKIKKEHNIKDKIKCVTYHIYWNSETEGKIEKHIPKQITEGFENKYQYIYHDKEGKEHEICTVNWMEIIGREKGVRVSGVPKGYIKTYKYPTSGGGDARNGYEYENGDIYVDGVGGYGNRKYPKQNGKVKIVRMKDSLSYAKGDVKIYYTFHGSDRRYCSPECYAGFIGALGELNRTDIQSTGMCFGDGTSYPSVSHNNGRSVDTRYLSNFNDEKKKVLAFKKFFFTDIITGTGGWYKNLPSHKHMGDHNDHLHAGVIDNKKVKTIEEVK